jgi:LysR family transcriptional regulator, nitrogen assimilation regulatory protein
MRIAVPDLRALNYFAHVARAGSFSGAAKALRITQPAVSRQVLKLEREIGVALLQRRGRSVVPTEAGQILLARATALNAAIETAYDDVRAGARAPAGSLSVGVSMILGHLIMPPLIHDFARKFPSVRLRLFEGYSTSVEEWLLQERIDVGLISGLSTATGLVLEPLLEVAVSLVAPPKPLPGCENNGRPVVEVRFEDFVRFPLIVPAFPHPLRLLAERAAKRAGSALNIVMECDGRILARELVMQGLGYTLLTETGSPHDIYAGQIREIRIGPSQPYWPLSIATRKGRRLTIASRELAKEIRMIAEARIASGELRGRIPGAALGGA